MFSQPIEQTYQHFSSRRDAIVHQYINNPALKRNDPVTYAKYKKELRDINKRLRIIRQCIPAHPNLA